jgi:hypothetical protein
MFVTRGADANFKPMQGAPPAHAAENPIATKTAPVTCW